MGKNPGPIVDADSGATIGEHRGTHEFTIGQRKGIGVEQPSQTGRPRYVLKIEPVTRTVVVGEREGLRVDAIRAQRAIWSAPVPEPGSEVLVQIRAHGDAVPARVISTSESDFGVELIGDLTALASGQSCVIYDRDRVLGQGTVS